MKTSNRKPIGFISYETAEVDEIVREGVEVINTQAEKVELSSFHKDTLFKLALMAKMVTGRAFKKMTAKQQNTYVKELAYYSELSTKLFLKTI